MLALLAVSRAARRTVAPSALASCQDFFFESACGSPHSVPCGHSPTCSREYRACAPCASGEQSFQAAAEEDDEDEDEDGEHLLKLQLLDTALEHVGKDGWTPAALQSAAKQIGYSPSFAGIVTRGEAELVEHFIIKSNGMLLGQLDALGPEFRQQRVPDQIKQAVRMRLEMLIPVIDTWPQALAVASRPENLRGSFKLGHDLVDSIWVAAGDTATDHSKYTKRALLAGVYSATELYMLTDCSPGFADTWDALDRRLHDISMIGASFRQVQDKVLEAVQTLMYKPK